MSNLEAQNPTPFSLYDILGGEGAIDAVVDTFYKKVLADDRIKHFFENTDMKRQHAHQKAFLSMAFGGPKKYTGKGMTIAHAKLVEKGLNDSHFDAVIELLGAAMTEHNVPTQYIGRAAALAETLRDAVLGRAPLEGTATAE